MARSSRDDNKNIDRQSLKLFRVSEMRKQSNVSWMCNVEMHFFSDAIEPCVAVVAPEQLQQVSILSNAGWLVLTTWNGFYSMRWSTTLLLYHHYSTDKYFSYRKMINQTFGPSRTVAKFVRLATNYLFCSRWRGIGLRWSTESNAAMKECIMSCHQNEFSVFFCLLRECVDVMNRPHFSLFSLSIAT